MSHCIGIELTVDVIRMVRIEHRRGKVSVLGTYTRRLTPDGLLQDVEASRTLLRDCLHQAGFGTNGKIVVGLPYEKVFFHNFRTKLSTRTDVQRLSRFELEDDFPVPFEELIVDICGHRETSEGDREYLVAGVSRRQLDLWAQVFETSRQKRAVLSTDVCAVQALARFTQPPEPDAVSLLLHVDGQRMVLGLLQQGSLICARHKCCVGDAEALASTLARDIELVLRAKQGRCDALPVRVLLSGPEDLTRELSVRVSRKTGRDIQLLQTASMVRKSQIVECDGTLNIALGLALLGVDAADDQLDFLRADPTKADRVARSKTKQAAFVSVGLMAVILGLLGFRTLRELSSLQAQETRLSRTIRTTFVESFPEEKKIVNELAQMTTHLDSLRRQRDALVAATGVTVRPLWALQVLSQTLASDAGIRISSFVVAGDTIRVAGTGDSFESIEQFQGKLRKVSQFDSVELEDMASSRGNERPGFRLLISVKAG